MKLDQRGDIAIAEIVFYVPILFLSIVLSVRHGATRKAGWILFAVLSIARIIGGITHVLSEQNPSNVTLQVIYTIVESAGLSPLLLATLGFLSTVAQYSLDNTPYMGVRTFRILHLLGTAAVILAVIGGVNMSNAKNEHDLNSAATIRHIGAILFVVLYAFIVAVTAFCWLNREQVLKYRRKLLFTIIASLPFLLVRVAYSVLGAFAPSSFGFDTEGHLIPVQSNSALRHFSSSTGDWAIYLVMSVLMECIVVLIYTSAGLRLPLKQDLVDYQRAETHIPMMSQEDDSYKYAQPYSYTQPYSQDPTQRV
ncbi:hypothetical protein BD309DRAFT_898715 [Dichomitus squalens]|uniref:DUF7702 domain-containing protein n=1 Tax=Dichomitus squalens TaxID=114155 RepID=A0A4Q9NJT9_9APHY|nr:hypothetical protein BD309DRAFT_898715 [Dichomitus squalens]TBU55715.1 hypothetical protein BD310DRAFT_856278 [Dichomitus squalens]